MKKKWWSSLRTKIIAWSFVPAVIILSAVAWFTYYSYQKVLADQAIKQDREILQGKLSQFVTALNEQAGPIILKIFMETDANHALPLETRAQNILSRTEGLDYYDGGIYFVDQQGKVFKTQPDQPALLGQDWSGIPQFRFLQEHNNNSVITDLRSIGDSEKKFICSVVAMVGQKGETAGAGFYCITIYPATQNAYYQSFKGLNWDPNVYVIDRNRRIVFSVDPDQMGKDVSAEAYIGQLLQQGSQSGRFRKGNIDMLVSYLPLSSIPDAVGWMIVKEQSWAEIMRPTLAYRQLLFALMALGVIIPVLVTAYGVRHITQPIQKLIQAAAQVTAGEFKQRIEVKTGDEIETLADQFNLMSAELDDSYSSLEKKVADRTRELAIMNSIISVASHSLDIEEILEDALNTTVEQMGFDAGAAFRFETDPTSILLVAQQGLEPAAAFDLVKRYADTSQRLPVYPKEVTTLGIEDFQDEMLKEQLSQLGFQLLVYIPLSTKGREQGFFVLGKREPGKPSPEELALLSSIGKQIGVAMENAHLYEQAEHTAVAAERTRLARELHDAVTQTLFSASLIADVTPRIWKRSPEEGLQNLEELRQLTHGALAEMRTLLLEMRPESLEKVDIKSLLTQLAEAFIGRVRVPLNLEIHGDCVLTHDVKIVFYRVAQEALNNIAKHSGARQVEICFECQPGHLNLQIKDDGLGFDPGSLPPGHLGIAIMRERASSIGAILGIESQPGQGTIVALDWRLARKDGKDEYASSDQGDVS